MIPATSFRNKKVAIFGLGSSGLATAKALLAGGAEVIAWDDNPANVINAAEQSIPTQDLRLIDWFTVDALILSPGVPFTHPNPHWSVELAQFANVEIIGDIEIFARERRAHVPDAPLIAITGTNGKSTTTALINHVFQTAGRKTAMGGNIGRAVMTFDVLEPDQTYIIECSSYQIDLAPSLNPTCGILLNLTPDHLDRHGSMENYAFVKRRLVAGSDIAIIGVDDEYGFTIANQLEHSGKKVIRISVTKQLQDGFYAEGSQLFHAELGNSQPFVSLESIGSLRGKHNAQNALAAAVACLNCGLTPEQISSGFRSFPGLAHRMEQVGRKDHVLFINDSKATNAEASAPALASFEHIYWIVGGLPKEGGIESLRSFFPKIAKAYLIGEAAPDFAVTIGNAAPFEISGTIEAAVANAARDAELSKLEDAVVLLSPACASFDQFRNFEARGNAFRDAALQLDGVTTIGGLGK